MEYLSQQLNIKEMSDWYNVTFTEIIRQGGHCLTIEYNTVAELLQAVYPEYQWDIYQFAKLPNGYFSQMLESSSLQEEFVKYLEKKLNITQTSDWYLVTTDQIQKFMSVNLSQVMKIVKNYYPDLDMKYFTYGNTLQTKKSQYTLKSILQDLFPDQEILEDYKHPDMNNLELDYYLPDLKLAFEYQVIFVSLNFFYY